jgi:uroporphyrin-III C-methyltransferase / precorrin-2 dehydrogenase / sirohydrochlorin ferrochelatase
VQEKILFFSGLHYATLRTRHCRRTMDYFPLFARLHGTRCLIVGGGEVAARKAKQLLRAGAAITIVAPEIHTELEQLATEGKLDLRREQFSKELIAGYQLIIAATSDTAVNREVANAAVHAQRFCNVVDDRELSSVIVPAVIDRSPLLIAVSTGGSSPVLATRIRQEIEALFPPAMADLAALTGQWRTAVQDRISDPDERRRFWQSIMNGKVADLLFAGRKQEASVAMQVLMDGHTPTHGEAWIVGAGPGDPELLTLKAARILGSAEVILHDRLVAPAILEMARRDAEFISVGKQAGKPSIQQDEINALLVRLVRAGKRVCRLKGGDPFIFGRGGEEIEALEAAGLPWQVVPGITAASACAATAGLPLTHRNLSRALVLTTAQGADDYQPDWSNLARAGQTVAFYMGVSQLPDICRELINAGQTPACPAVLIENGSTLQERRIQGTLATLPQLAMEAGAVSPALVIVGEVVGLARAQTAVQDEAAPASLWSRAAARPTNGQ